MDIKYCVIKNIPSSLHSIELRTFFSSILERDGFCCFHFRHRPEICENFSAHSTVVANSALKTTCCFVKVFTKIYDNFKHLYHRKHWQDSSGNGLPFLCMIQGIDISSSDTDFEKALQTVSSEDFKTLSNISLSLQQLNSLSEFKPPALIPQGNVGTSTKHFLSLINQCRLPSKLIGRLGLKFVRTRPRKEFSSVPYDYECVNDCMSQSDDNSSDDKKILDRCHEEDKLSEDAASEQDVDECEEWERHEAFVDDPDCQERNKERLFEEEIELQWEKGGSGLVFYTDAQYWQAADGDFDEQTADDWDVDMSVYYENNGGDKDAKDGLLMRKESQQRYDSPINCDFGTFEKHTKGIGRKILRKQGWKDGSGVGASTQGRYLPVDGDGQSSRDKSGLGYRGEKLARYRTGKRLKRSSLISTCYDSPPGLDYADEIFRRKEPTALKYRQGYVIGTKHK